MYVGIIWVCQILVVLMLCWCKKGWDIVVGIFSCFLVEMRFDEGGVCEDLWEKFKCMCVELVVKVVVRVVDMLSQG